MKSLLAAASIVLALAASMLTPPTTASAQAQQDWQRIHGKVEKIEGTTLTFKADDGRTLTVDLTQVTESVRQGLEAGEGATVIGFYRGDQNHVAARFVQQDSSDPARGGKVTPPAASPPTGK